MSINVVMLLLAEYVVKYHMAIDKSEALEQQLVEAQAEIERLRGGDDGVAE